MLRELIHCELLLIGRVEYAKLEAATLAHVDDSYYSGAYCRKCKHHAPLSLVKLRQHLGDTYSLVKVKDRLRLLPICLASRFDNDPELAKRGRAHLERILEL